MSASLKRRPSTVARKPPRLPRVLRLHQKRLLLKMSPFLLPMSTLTGRRQYLRFSELSSGMLKTRLPVVVMPMSTPLRKKSQAQKVA
jgi:hypothetical protein